MDFCMCLRIWQTQRMNHRHTLKQRRQQIPSASAANDYDGSVSGRSSNVGVGGCKARLFPLFSLFGRLSATHCLSAQRAGATASCRSHQSRPDCCRKQASLSHFTAHADQPHRSPDCFCAKLHTNTGRKEACSRTPCRAGLLNSVAGSSSAHAWAEVGSPVAITPLPPPFSLPLLLLPLPLPLPPEPNRRRRCAAQLAAVRVAVQQRRPRRLN